MKTMKTPQGKDQQIFPINGQKVTILDIVEGMVFVAANQSHYYYKKEATDNM